MFVCTVVRKAEIYLWEWGAKNMQEPYTSGIGRTMQKYFRGWKIYFTGVGPHQNNFPTRGQVPNNYFGTICWAYRRIAGLWSSVSRVTSACFLGINVGGLPWRAGCLSTGDVDCCMWMLYPPPLPREHIAESSWLQTFATGMTTHAHTHTHTGSAKLSNTVATCRAETIFDRVYWGNIIPVCAFDCRGWARRLPTSGSNLDYQKNPGICFANDAFRHVLLSIKISCVPGDIHLFLPRSRWTGFMPFFWLYSWSYGDGRYGPWFDTMEWEGVMLWYLSWLCGRLWC